MRLRARFFAARCVLGMLMHLKKGCKALKGIALREFTPPLRQGKTQRRTVAGFQEAEFQRNIRGEHACIARCAGFPRKVIQQGLPVVEAAASLPQSLLKRYKPRPVKPQRGKKLARIVCLMRCNSKLCLRCKRFKRIQNAEADRRIINEHGAEAPD